MHFSRVSISIWNFYNEKKIVKLFFSVYFSLCYTIHSLQLVQKQFDPICSFWDIIFTECDHENQYVVLKNHTRFRMISCYLKRCLLQRQILILLRLSFAILVTCPAHHSLSSVTQRIRDYIAWHLVSMKSPDWLRETRTPCLLVNSSPEIPGIRNILEWTWCD